MKRVIKFRAYTEISNEVLGMEYEACDDEVEIIGNIYENPDLIVNK